MGEREEAPMDIASAISSLMVETGRASRRELGADATKYRGWLNEKITSALTAAHAAGKAEGLAEERARMLEVFKACAPPENVWIPTMLTAITTPTPEPG